MCCPDWIGECSLSWLNSRQLGGRLGWSDAYARTGTGAVRLSFDRERPAGGGAVPAVPSAAMRAGGRRPVRPPPEPALLPAKPVGAGLLQGRSGYRRDCEYPACSLRLHREMLKYSCLGVRREQAKGNERCVRVRLVFSNPHWTYTRQFENEIAQTEYVGSPNRCI